MAAKPQHVLLALASLSGLAGCSLRSIASKNLADALSGSGSAFGGDDDPELIEAAAPFGLKTMERLVSEQPKHIPLLTALASGYTQFSYAFVQQDADELEDHDIARANQQRARARRLYLRGRNYGLAALDVLHPGFRAAALSGQSGVLKEHIEKTTKSDVALLYWTAASWTLAIATGKDHMDLVGELPAAEALITRALALDEAFDRGTIHEFFIAYDGARSVGEGGGPARAKAHLDRALVLAENKRLGPLVSYAEMVAVAKQDRKEFTRLLERVVSTDVDRAPEERLANVIAQRRARWLLGRTQELFAD